MPWYKAGTVSVTQSSNAIIGTNTEFIANCRVGDAFLGPDGKWYEVTNIASNTGLSISPSYQGATSAAGSYALTPIQGYQKGLADQVRDWVNTYGAKMAALGTTGNYDTLPIAKGGTGGTTQATARSGLGLGTAATANLGTGSGNAMAVGAFGLGVRGTATLPNMNTFNTEIAIIADATIYRPINYGTVINLGYPGGNIGSQLYMGVSPGGVIGFRSGDYSTAAFNTIYHTGNTTRGSGGVLSAASPILRIANVADSQRQDLDEQTFESAGAWGMANNEARGVSVERFGVGEYRVTGSLGLALEGWRIQDPCSPDGGGTLGITESEQDADGTVTIRLFKQRWTLSEDGEMIPGRGAPLDVPLNSWIDVRLEMPQPETPPPPTTLETE
ncbi:hypothetical protein ACLBNB_19770 [Pseudomonas chlororaphis subsp. aurantiaca]|uniref:phage tail fiber protein n=1 Tax=Pseudomonas chlororaphis TaxID=587753 RepID=UPI00398AD10D